MHFLVFLDRDIVGESRIISVKEIVMIVYLWGGIGRFGWCK